MSTVCLMDEQDVKRPWDGYCQPGHATGSRRLRMVTRLRKEASQDHDIHHGWLSDRSCWAWHHYDDIYRELAYAARKPTYERREAWEVRGPRNEDQIPIPYIGPV